MKKIHALLLASCAIIFYSCSKDDNNDPPNNQVEAEKLQASIAAKWQLDPAALEPLLPKNVVTPPVSANNFLRAFRGSLNNNIETNDANPGSGTPILTFAEFYSDSSFIVSYNGVLLLEGKFKAVSGDSILLTPYGSLGGIRIVDGKLEGRLHANELQKTVNIIGTKAAGVTETARTTLFCREWYLAREEDYEQAYDAYTDSLTIRISNNGTYLVKLFKNKEVVKALVQGWKWYDNNETKFYYFPLDYPQDLGTVTIRDLTRDALKATESYNSDDIPGDETYNWTFYPVKK